MKAKVIVDNIADNAACGEWGLSIYIEFEGGKYLLDAGASGLVVQNAEILGIDLADIDAAVLSHAHHDHSDGMPAFFEKNKKAQLFVRECTGECCYGIKDNVMAYIGIRQGMLSEYADRITYVKGDYELAPGVFLIPHKSKEAVKAGIRESMFRIEKEKKVPDDFAHEQSLVFELADGLVVFNSCSHAGPDVIIDEIEKTFPDRRIIVYAGGFHQFTRSEAEVCALAEKLAGMKIDRYYTGHCTGDQAFAVLKKALGERVQLFSVGFEMEF